MELRHLRYFLAAAEEPTITRAAQRLGIAQPPLTQQIKALEAELSVPLFARAGRGVVLTEAGRVLMEEARAILARVERATALARQAGRGERGPLRIGLTGSAGFNPAVTALLRAVREAWPEVELRLEEARTSELLSALAQRRLDAAVLRPVDPPMEGLATRPLAREPMVVAVPLAHPLARRRSVRLGALRGEGFVLYPRSGGRGLSEAVVEACRHAGFEPRAAQHSPQMTSTINLVAAAAGIAVVPACMRHLRPDAVRFLPLRDGGLVAELQLAFDPRNAAPTLHTLLATVEASSGRR